MSRGGGGGSRRVLALAILACAVAAALASAQTGAPTSVQESKCWTCHKEGGTVAGTPLRSMYSIQPPGTLVLQAGNPTPLVVGVHNDWKARVHNIVGSLDLSKAPSLGFQPPPAPVLGRSRDGTLPFDATQANQPERAANVKVNVPPGATDIRVRLAPARATGADAPDLVLRLWPEGVSTKLANAQEVDDVGKGATEAYHLRSPDAIARMGYGNWTVQAAQAGFAAQPDPAALVEQAFTVTVDAWFNLTGTRTQLVGSTASLDGRSEDGPQVATLQWNLFVQAAPRKGEELAITVQAVGSFEHAPQFNAVDDWSFTQTLRVPIQVPDATTGGPPGQTTITLNTTTSTPPPVTASGGLFIWSEKEWGEAVGYLTSYLMASALVTGGVFGMASRRGLNRLFRTARRRIAFHNVTSYLILIVAAVHTFLFIHEAEFPWTLGLLWGGLAVLFLILLGVTGAWQLHLIRAWGYKAWRWTHYGMAIAALVFTLAHLALDGIHFEWLQERLHWKDPVGRWFGL